MNDFSQLGIFPFFRSLIGWHSFGGPSLFILRSMVVASTSGAISGMLCALVGGVVLGTGSLPFVIGASLGFTGGLWNHYNHSMVEATVALEDFPSLMLLHLDANFPLYRWRKRVGESFSHTRLGWKERSMLVTAWQSARSAVEVS